MSIPSWLTTPSASQIRPPVETRLQELPFAELAWEDFEKLCLRLVRLEADVGHCQLYGERGQEQEGIDLYARQKLSGAYTVYQCKRVKGFGPAKIQKAVSDFLEGEWTAKATTLVLCTSESLRSTDRTDTFEKQRVLLKQKGITLLSWDSDQLSAKLKDCPLLVDDFFGRAWVSAFLGEEQANRLGNRLDAHSVVEFRRKLAVFYRHVFHTHDPGLPIAALDGAGLLPLEGRYVVPDVWDQRAISISSTRIADSGTPQEELRGRPSERTTFEGVQPNREKRSTTISQLRQPVERWLATAKRNIILGGPGSGKSSLLRFIAINLLQDSPSLSLLSQQWGQFLPVWVPFAFWTREITSQPTAITSLSQILHNWIKSWDEERLWPLIEQALDDDRLLLLVDGLG